MQELLVLIVVVLALFYLPRLMGRGPAPEPVRRRKAPLTGRMRLAILLSLFWIAGAAALLEPWRFDPLPFFSFGVGPVAAMWGSVWVWFGYRRSRR